MGPSGARKFLQPALYFAVAVLVHGLLFLIPGGLGKQESGMTRGVRVRVQGESRGGSAASRPTPVASRSSAPLVPTAPMDRDATPAGSPGGGGGTPGGAPGGAGGTESMGGPVAGSRPQSSEEYGSYLARLKSEGVQGWARESAGKMRQGWRGSGKSGTGWGGGSGSGAGTGTGGGTGPRFDGGGYLDPRVRVVVTSYPPTGIEKRHTQVPYPEIKVKKTDYVSGWWNVYVRLQTDGNGRVVRSFVLLPETDGPLEKIFVAQVKREIDKWTFDRKEAEINVDVRFYVE